MCLTKIVYSAVHFQNEFRKRGLNLSHWDVCQIKFSLFVSIILMVVNNWNYIYLENQLCEDKTLSYNQEVKIKSSIFFLSYPYTRGVWTRTNLEVFTLPNDVTLVQEIIIKINNYTISI